MEVVESGIIELDVLCVEGVIVIGLKGIGRFYVLFGMGCLMLDWVRSLVLKVCYVVVVGICVIYGGILIVGGNLFFVVGV